MKRSRPGRRAPKRPRARVSLRQLAAQLKVSEGAVRKRLRAGGFSARAVSRGPNGRPRVLDAALAIREWAANRAKPSPLAPADEPKAAGRPATLTEAQIRVSFQREVKLELENLQKRGILIDAAKERRGDFEHARTVRDSMLNIPDRLAAELAAETDARRVHARLDEEIRKALDTLADIFLFEDRDPDRGDGDAGE